MLTSDQAAKLLGNISPRRVRALCALGRIQGAVKVNPRCWLLPDTFNDPRKEPGRPVNLCITKT